MVRPGRDHQESAREPPAAGTAHRVGGLPRDEHGHDRGLAGAGRELERQPVETGVRLLVGGGEMVEESAAFVAEPWRDLGQPDRGLRRFDLAEEGPDVAEAVAAPVLQEPSRLGSHPPPAGIRNRSPRIDPAPQLVDDLHQLVLLTLLLQRLRRRVEDHLVLATLLRPRDRRDERDTAAAVEDLARGLAALVELPVPRRVLVGRVEDGPVEKLVAHGGASLSHGSDRGAFPEVVSGRSRTAQSFAYRRSVVHVSGNLVAWPEGPPAPRRVNPIREGFGRSAVLALDALSVEHPTTPHVQAVRPPALPRRWRRRRVEPRAQSGELRR